MFIGIISNFKFSQSPIPSVWGGKKLDGATGNHTLLVFCYLIFDICVMLGSRESRERILTIFCFFPRNAWHSSKSCLLTAMKENTWVKVESAEQ